MRQSQEKLPPDLSGVTKPDRSQPPLDLRVVSSTDMTAAQQAQVVDLCSTVFHIDYAYFMGLDLYRTHVLGYVGPRLVAHALWLERRLRVGAGQWLNAAYIEGVATHEDYRHRGFASAVMRRLQSHIEAYDLAALGTGVPDFYAPLGWQPWRGPLFIVKDGIAEATPQHLVMVWLTPRSAGLNIDLDAPLTGEARPFDPW